MHKAVNKKVMAAYLTERFNFNQEFAENIVDELVNFIRVSLLNGKTVSFPNLGKLQIVSSERAKSGKRVVFIISQHLRAVL